MFKIQKLVANLTLYTPCVQFLRLERVITEVTKIQTDFCLVPLKRFLVRSIGKMLYTVSSNVIIVIAPDALYEK